MYGNYIINIIKYFSVIITYSTGNIIPNHDVTILKIENKGMDIGAKINCFKYLNDTNINYSRILMLHSKTDVKSRNEYFNPFLKNLKYINSIINDFDLIIPNLIRRGGLHFNIYIKNKLYYDEYNNFMNFKKLTYYFVEGNCLISSKKLIDTIYPPDKLELFYNILNTKNTFDYNWVCYNYFIFNKNIYELYDYVIKNDLEKNHFNKKWRDSSIEHLWERLWINTAMNFCFPIKILKDEELRTYNKWLLTKYEEKNQSDLMRTGIYVRIYNEYNIIEWMEYHYKCGFDFILLYDDYSEPSVKSIIEKYGKFNKNKYQVLERLFPKNRLTHSFLTDKNIFQKYFLPIIKKKMDYVLYIDMDEYLYMNKFKNIKELIKYYGNFDQLYIYWKFFCKKNKKDKLNNLIENVTESQKKISVIGKSICKTNSIKYNNQGHYFVLNKKNPIIIDSFKRKFKTSNQLINMDKKLPKFDFNTRKDYLYIGHYYMHSISDFLERRIFLPPNIFKNHPDPKLKKLNIDKVIEFNNDKNKKELIDYIFNFNKNKFKIPLFFEKDGVITNNFSNCIDLCKNFKEKVAIIYYIQLSYASVKNTDILNFYKSGN